MKGDRTELALNWPSAFVVPLGDFSPSGKRGEADKLKVNSSQQRWSRWQITATVVRRTFTSDQRSAKVELLPKMHHFFIAFI